MTMLSDMFAGGSHLIGGEELDTAVPDGAEGVESINPYSGEVLWKRHAATSEDVDRAVAVAREAFPSWARMGFEERHRLLDRFVALVQEEASPLALLIATEAGKPLWESAMEVNSLVTKLQASVEAYRARATESSRVVRGMCSRTRFLPHGVMAVLGPFNFPASMANSHIMPSLLAGNTVIFKPSELTPVTGLAVSRIWQRAGLPPGVMNCVTGGRETGQALVEHRDTNGVLLVGSHAAGMAILRKLAASPEKMSSLEMGGNSPLMIWDYKDLDATVAIVIQSCFMSSGQRCTAARRLLVREGDDALVPRLVEVLQRLRIGNFSLTPEPYYGPMIRRTAATQVLRRFEELVAAGAHPELVPVQQGPIGTLISPGVLNIGTGVPDRDEEIFGPVLKTYRYSTFEEGVTLANNTKFGLAAGIVCKRREDFDAFVGGVRAGIVNWNKPLTGATTFAPFGGIKQSGNFRPAGFLSVDYCSYAIASFEVETPTVPDPPIPGISF